MVLTGVAVEIIVILVVLAGIKNGLVFSYNLPLLPPAVQKVSAVRVSFEICLFVLEKGNIVNCSESLNIGLYIKFIKKMPLLPPIS